VTEKKKFWGNGGNGKSETTETESKKKKNFTNKKNISQVIK
jgi:hypothetical protein